MFKVKATVVGFAGDQELYPCHMQHKVGDEIIFDGESYHGRLCPDVWPLIAPKVSAMHQAGPRYKEWAAYYPFWYTSVSTKDESMKKYDGLGYRCNLQTIVPPAHDMANLVPPDAYKWPPHEQRDIMSAVTVTCLDARTSMVMVLEAFDLSDKGFDVPFFRRQMAILQKLKTFGPTPAEKVLETFTTEQIETIYPPLGGVLVEIMLEELVLMGFAELTDGVASITDKGQLKLADFIGSLTEEERELFGDYMQR
jgi:uncharacterized repeat protein (TIGR04076 family)